MREAEGSTGRMVVAEMAKVSARLCMIFRSRFKNLYKLALHAARLESFGRHCRLASALVQCRLLLSNNMIFSSQIMDPKT